MQVFDAKNWKVEKGETLLPLDTSRREIALQVSCTEEVQLLGVYEGQKIPLKIGKDYRVKVETRQFSSLILKGKPGVEYGFNYQDRERQDGEAVDNSNPPPPPMPNNSNFLLQVRNIMRQELNRTRLPTMDPEDAQFINYDIDDEDEGLFEEELAQRRLDELSQEEKNSKEDHSSSQPAKPSTDADEPLSGASPAEVPEARPGRLETASPDQQAAE